jgi:hypothetical protein
MSENKKDKKNKNLNEKEIKKISGGCGTKPCLPESSFVSLVYGGPKFNPVIAYGGPGFNKPVKIVPLKEIQSEKKTSDPIKTKNLQPFSDEDKN